MFHVHSLALSIMIIRHQLIELLLNQQYCFRIERLHANDSIMIQLGDDLQGGSLRELICLLHWLAPT